MSQYPSPYQQPQYQGQYQPGYMGMDPFEQALAPCRRAGVLMFVLAGLLCLMGICFGGVFLAAPLEDMFAQSGVQMPPGVTLEIMKFAMLIFSGAVLVAGIIYLVLGIFVRRGSKGAAITGLVLSFLGIGYLAIEIVGALAMSRQMGMQAAMGACFLIVPAGLLLWLIIWLFQAIGASSNYRNLQMQYQAQYYGYQQQQQMYGQQPQYPYPPQQQQWPGQYPQQPPPPQPPQT